MQLPRNNYFLTLCSQIANICFVSRQLRIEWSIRAVKDMRRLDPQNRERVVDKIEQYADDPASLTNQVTALLGSEYLRMRVGLCRVIFKLEHENPVAMAIRGVLHRREAHD